VSHRSLRTAAPSIMEGMIFKRRRKNKSEPGGYFHIENELNHRKMFGFGHGGQIKLQDANGTEWRGTAEKGDDDAVYYRFRNADGRLVSGMGHGGHVMLRDEKGSIWKGFVD
jgi:hypothetical protein